MSILLRLTSTGCVTSKGEYHSVFPLEQLALRPTTDQPNGT